MELFVKAIRPESKLNKACKAHTVLCRMCDALNQRQHLPRAAWLDQ